MKRNIYLLLFILTGCFISCEKDIQFKGTVTDPLLVLNSILTPDSVVSVHLSQSRFILGESAPLNPISGATVSVFVNGGLKEQLTYDANGIYTGTYFPRPGDEIKIEVIADGYDQVKSQTVIPGKPGVVVTDSTVTVREEEYSSPYQPNTVHKTTTRNMQVQLKLTDAVNEENYYFIKVSQNYYRKDELLLVWPIELKLSEVLKNNITDNGNIFQELFGDEGNADRVDNLFSDLFVNGKDILFDFSFYDTLESATYVNGEKIKDGNNNEEELTVEYIVEIGEISRDLYQYVISGNQAVNAEDYGPFSEPVRVHTNIENGIGILGAYNTYRFISRFQTKYFPYSFLP
ncbi:DUF4249 domain-containing protein [uncultured Proteiniphilum sp.]|uniref:DUF4249 domain-containing protein n=1 Tax=uncultured Proteiniphilum sp. TaxID=497637 RepID=UPI00262C4F73|nr:DUF4249 domain-containing protein [uncultured Proteiniphilum sp.]